MKMRICNRLLIRVTLILGVALTANAVKVTSVGDELADRRPGSEERISTAGVRADVRTKCYEDKPAKSESGNPDGSNGGRAEGQKDVAKVNAAKDVLDLEFQKLEHLPPPSIRLHGQIARPILLVGDSMSMGGFGESMQTYLVDRFGRSNVAFFASSGSSPEHWLRSGPTFVTKCGYLEITPLVSIKHDFENGRRPKPVLTPKLEDLLREYRPATMIVQLGTNWMDEISTRMLPNNAKYNEILEQFVAVVKGDPHSVRQIIWITPPDSSCFSNGVKQTVQSVIMNAARNFGFEIIDSMKVTHFVSGKSGRDGVHYNDEEARVWASFVTRDLDRMMQ